MFTRGTAPAELPVGIVTAIIGVYLPCNLFQQKVRILNVSSALKATDIEVKFGSMILDGKFRIEIEAER